MPQPLNRLASPRGNGSCRARQRLTKRGTGRPETGRSPTPPTSAPGRVMTDVQTRAYFAVGPPMDEGNFLTGSAVHGKVRISASPTARLTPAEARKLAQYLLFAAARAEEHAGG